MLPTESNSGKEIIWIDHQNGKLAYYLDDDGKAVLWDYIGDTPILYLPCSLDYEDNWIEVCTSVPDEAFQSCTSVKLIIADCRFESWDFGYFIFRNCEKLKALIELRFYYNTEDYGLELQWAGFSFVDKLSFIESDFTPVDLTSLEMTFDNEVFGGGIFKRFIDILNRKKMDYELKQVLEYSHTYTDKFLESCDDPRELEVAMRHGCDIAALVSVAQCWEEAKQSTQTF